MASVIICPATVPASAVASSSFRLPFFKKSTSQIHKCCLKVRCKVNQPGDLDRRNVLIGLGGLYTAANLPQPALSDPIKAPDLTQCGSADLPEGANPVNCCPPTGNNKIVDSQVEYKARSRVTTSQATETTSSTATTQPAIVLGKTPVTVEVSRSKKKRSQKEKEDEEEVLLIEGIELDRKVFVKFDVLINDEDRGKSLTRPNKTEFAGTFVNVPHLHKEGMKMKIRTCLRLGITDLLEDLDVEDDESVLVTLVPKRVTTDITIATVKIVFE